jgi:predicted pyridoxine 5'-phosphate oxidase superfamily flavin-nucleotide-binding protein
VTADAAITPELAAFLRGIDSAFLATASADGDPYVQHRGGAPGFLHVLDDHAIGFLDLAGNRQYLTIGNLAENPRVCLIVVDYPRRARVKIWGTARVLALDHPDAVAIPRPPRGRPERAIRIDVTRWDVNCPAHIPVTPNASAATRSTPC